MEEKLAIKEEESDRRFARSLPGIEAITIPRSPTLANRLYSLLIALRPRQWTKNLAVFVGLIFSQQLFSLPSLERTVTAFLTFCFASSGIYLMNDLLDLEKDRHHPVKSQRPLASGRLSISWAIAAMILLGLACSAAIAAVFHLPLVPQTDNYNLLGGSNLLFALSISFYIFIMIMYNVHLKHVVLLDVFIIAAGFVMRILAGAVVIPVHISPWLYLVTILLSLFLALGKRRNELVLLQEQAVKHRKNLKDYSLPLLDQMITIVLTATLVAYSLYTFQGLTGNHHLMATIPVVLYGMFRYLYLVNMHKGGGSPEEILLRDRHVLGAVVLCITIVVVVLYVLPR